MLELHTPTLSTAAAPNPTFPTPTETWIPSRFPLRQGKHPGSCRNGILLRPHPGAGGTSGSPQELFDSPNPGYSGKFCLESCSSAADFTRMSAPGLRGINDFLAVCRERGGSRQLFLSPFILACLEPGDFS